MVSESSEINDQQDKEEYDLKMKKINSLLDKDEKSDKNSKTYEQDIIKQLTTVDANIYDEESLKFIQYGVLFNVKDLKQIYYTMNEYKVINQQLEKSNEQF